MAKPSRKGGPASGRADLVPAERRGRRKSERTPPANDADLRDDQLSEVVAGLVALQASHDQLVTEVRALRREVAKLRPPVKSATVSRRGRPPAAGG